MDHSVLAQTGNNQTRNEQSMADQHPIGVYLKVWILLFVLSTFSYMVDYFDFQGMVRWTLIIIFMLPRYCVITGLVGKP